MSRIHAVSVCSALLVLAVTPVKADGIGYPSQKMPFYSTIAPHAAYPYSLGGWPMAPRDPAIARTLRANPPAYAPPVQHAPQYERYQAPPPALAPQWQQPTYPGSRFSYPQQGFFPREGYQNQHPGYEYDFDPGQGYGSQFPMEGATWRTGGALRDSRPPAGRQAVPIRNNFFGTFPDCPAYLRR